MKILTLVCFNEEDSKNFKKIINNTFKRNSLFIKKDKSLYVKNKLNSQFVDEFKIQYEVVNLENINIVKKFLEMIEENIFIAHDIAVEIVKPGIIKIKKELLCSRGCINAMIYPLIEKTSAKINSEERINGIIDLIIEIGIKIITNHYWEDANKRTGIVTLALLFNEIGLRISWSNDLLSKEYYQRWDKIARELVVEWTNPWDKNQENIKKIKNKFKNEIIRGLMLNANKIK